MAEEDLIFGKNRHLFGGIAPSNMIRFSCVDKFSTTTLDLILPKDTVIDGQTLCTVAGVVIRGKNDSYPVDEFDGDFIADLKLDGGSSYSLDVVDTLHYYFSAFPYSTQGVYNRNKANRCKGNVPKGYLYGFDLDLNDSDTSTRVTYPIDVDNHNYDSAYIDTITGSLNYGHWANTPGVNFMPRPCVIYPSGTVKEYLNPNDYSKTVDGDASSVATSANGINAMMEWPKIYTHREVVNNVYKFRCSDTKLGDDWECWCNYDINGNEIDHFYTGIYIGTKDGNDVLRSISGSTHTTFTTTDAIITAAKANGSGWYTDVVCDRLLIQDLLVMISKSTNGQINFGGGYNTNTINGTMDDKGLFAATLSSDGSFPIAGKCKVFGMENWWSPYYRYIGGWMCDKGVMKVKINIGSDEYTHIANSTPSGTTGGYISKTVTVPFGRFPVEASGSATTYECDSLEFNNQYSYPAYAQASIPSGYKCGPFAVTFANATSICSSLSYKPLA